MEKQRWEESERRRKEVRRSEKRKQRRKKMQVREKVGKSRFTVFFPWSVALEGRKVGSLKRRVWSQLARWEMKNCTPLWREAHFQVKMYKTHKTRHSQTTFGSWDVEKAHAVVARSTCPSQNAQNTPTSEHFWKLRCRKVHAVVKHISKSKCTKHTMHGPLLEVEMSKKCTPRSTFPSQECKKLTGPDHFWKFRCQKSAHRFAAQNSSKSKVSITEGFEPFLTFSCRKVQTNTN